MPETQVQTKSRVGIAVGLSIAAGIAGIVGVSFALVQTSGTGGGGGTATPGDTTGGTDVSLVSTYKPTALQLKDLTSGSISTYWPGTTYDPFPGTGSIEILAGSTILGTFTHSGGSVAFNDGVSLTSPAKVTLRLTGDDPVTDYARIALQTDLGEKTICVPQSWNGTLGPTLYVDSQGGTYQDAKMTKWAMLCSYPEMELKQISAVTTDNPISLPENVHGGITILYAPYFYYQTSLFGGNVLFGRYWPETGWQAQSDYDEMAKPLAVYLSEGAVAAPDGSPRYIKLDYPQQTLSLTTDRGTQTVCLPAAKSYSKFFVAPNGSTYTDIWLTKLVRACP